jgi:hypothetical protein
LPPSFLCTLNVSTIPKYPGLVRDDIRSGDDRFVPLIPVQDPPGKARA